MGDGVHGDKPTQQEEQESTKRCSKCGETKSLTDFHKDRSKKDGLRPSCKVCHLPEVAKWRAANKDYNAAYLAKWRAANPGYGSAAKAKWRAANPDKDLAYKHRRRARKRNAPGTFTAGQWKARLAYHGYRCIYCGVEKHETPQGWLTCEHLIPLSRGGSNWPSNLAPSCTSCNCSKGTRTHFEYLEYLNEKDV